MFRAKGLGGHLKLVLINDVPRAVRTLHTALHVMLSEERRDLTSTTDVLSRTRLEPRDSTLACPSAPRPRQTFWLLELKIEPRSDVSPPCLLVSGKLPGAP